MTPRGPVKGSLTYSDDTVRASHPSAANPSRCTAASASEFAETLGHLAEGRIAVEPLVTGRVGVEGEPGAFRDLACPDAHVKVLVEPWR